MFKKKLILNTGITRNPDEYMYDILWGESDSTIVRDKEGVEETETNEEKREKNEREREERERINKYKNMETNEIRKRLGVLQKMNKSQRTGRQIKN